MKNSLKRLLARAGFRLHRVNRDLTDGHDLARDLPLVLGKREGLICLDVGAHSGDFVALLRKCLRNPFIHAFEPAPQPFARLKAAYGTASGVSLINAGLGSDCHKLEFNVFENEALNSFLPLDSNGRSTFQQVSEATHLNVEVLRLDDYAQQHKISHIDLLKIDTQGYELHVLKGAEELLSRGAIGAALVELNFTELYKDQVWGHEVMQHLHNHGFRLIDFYEKCRLNPYLGWCTALFAHPTPAQSR